MTSDGEGGLDLPSPRRHDTRASSAPATTMSGSENTKTTQAMMTLPPWPTPLRPNTDLRFERRHAH
jgi:hypothetical protein